MIISSCKMAAKGEKADYHLRLVQIKLRKNVCKSLWKKMCKHQQLFDSRDAVVPPLPIYVICYTCSRENYALSHDSSHVYPFFGRRPETWPDVFFLSFPRPLINARTCVHVHGESTAGPPTESEVHHTHTFLFAMHRGLAVTGIFIFTWHFLGIYNYLC